MVCVRAGLQELTVPMSSPNSTFSAMLVCRSQPWWEYLHHGHGQMLHIRASSRELIDQHVPAQDHPYAGIDGV